MFENNLEIYPLAAIKIVYHSNEYPLQFSKAELHVDTSDIYWSWFIDITNITDHQLLERLANALDIQIMMYARTITGLEIAGEGYIHPNLVFDCAAIKGEGEIIGYEQIKQAAHQ